MAIYSPPVRLGGQGSVMFISVPSHRNAARSDRDTPSDVVTKADQLEAISDSEDITHRATPSRAFANANDVRSACRIALKFSGDFKRSRSGASTMPVGKLDAIRRRLRWKLLPKTGRCDDKHTMNFHSKGFGEYVEEFAETSDRKVVAIRGGWQLDPLAGAGGECLYEQLPKGRFNLLGCVQTSVS